MSPADQFALFAPMEADDEAESSASSGTACPRCGSLLDTSAERFYGPCADCRAQLRAKFLGDGRAVEVAEYEPKMNVTPNAVALKDD
ncbi:MAG: hypothetical protein ACKO27_04845 [Ilumatobacteraceae bacterium]